MIDQDTDGLAQSSARSTSLGPAAPSDVEAYGRVSDSVGRRNRARPAPVDLSSPLASFESSPIGEYLRRQRVLRDVSIDELSALTRIPLRSLERLERGEFDGQADGFVRGFVRTVAEALGLDADDTVARILQEPAVGVWERHASNRRLKQALVAAGLLILLGLGFLILQAGWRVLTGGGENDPARQVVMWRDPVRSLAEATGAEVDPAGEIDLSKRPTVPSPTAVLPSGPATPVGRATPSRR